MISTTEVYIILSEPVAHQAATPPTYPPSRINPPHVPVSPDPSTLPDHFPIPTMPEQVDEIADELVTLVVTSQVELIRWRYCLSQRSFRILRILAYPRIILYHLRSVSPTCVDDVSTAVRQGHHGDLNTLPIVVTHILPHVLENAYLSAKLKVTHLIFLSNLRAASSVVDTELLLYFR